ncbi:MAG: 2-keto-4-pentenoate hydratase, partial [Betaproteobacteria bacterium]
RVQGDEVGGYKCSLPAEGREVGMAPIFGLTISSASPRHLRAPLLTLPDAARIEPEIAFVMARALPPRAKPYAEAEVRAAIGETRLVLELLGSRYRDPTALPFIETLADCISNQGLHVGPLADGGLDAPLEAFAFRVESKGAAGTPDFVLEKDGKHPDGHPLRPLVWLANFLAARGSGLREGQIVTTGSYAGAVEVPLGVPLHMQFGDLGAIDVEFRRTAD